MPFMTASTSKVPLSGKNVRRGWRTRLWRGFTLIELMTGMFVFSIMSISITSMVIQIRRVSQINILKVAAATVAQGYCEQIVSMDPSSVESASEFWVTGRPSLPTVAVNSLLSNTTNIQVSDPLWVSPLSTAPTGSGMIARTDVPGDMWNVKQIMVDLYTASNGTLVPVTMTMYLDVNISRNWQQLNGLWQPPTSPYMLVKIDYQFHGNGYLGTSWLKGSVRMVRTDIAGF